MIQHIESFSYLPIKVSSNKKCLREHCEKLLTLIKDLWIIHFGSKFWLGDTENNKASVQYHELDIKSKKRQDTECKSRNRCEDDGPRPKVSPTSSPMSRTPPRHLVTWTVREILNGEDRTISYRWCAGLFRGRSSSLSPDLATSMYSHCSADALWGKRHLKDPKTTPTDSQRTLTSLITTSTRPNF